MKSKRYTTEDKIRILRLSRFTYWYRGRAPTTARQLLRQRLRELSDEQLCQGNGGQLVFTECLGGGRAATSNDSQTGLGLTAR